MLTRQGVVALAAAAVLYGLAVWLGYRSLAALALALVVVPLLGLAHLLRRADYDVTRELLPGPRVTAGEPVLVTLTLANRSSRRSPAVEVVEPVGAATRRLRVPRLAGGASTTVGYSLDDLPRGRYRIGPLTVDRSDPFGFVAATTACGSVDTLRVHPRIHPVEPLASGRLRDLDGPAVDKALEGTVTFHGLREYVRGDDRRHIHWKSSARTGTLMVKQHVDVSEPRTAVVLDTCADHHPAATFEAAVEVAASLVAASGRHHFPVVLHDTSGARTAAGRDGVVTGLLDALAGVDATAPGGVADVVGRLRDEEVGTSLVLVTGRLTDRDAAALAAVRRQYDSVVAVVVAGDGDAPAPPRPPGVRVVTLSGAEELGRAWQAQH